MAQKKFYVVWNGRKKGVFDSWDECQKQIKDFPGAVYKSFPTQTIAQQAFKGLSKDYIGKNTTKSSLSKTELAKIGQPNLNSISVDGAWNTVSGDAEYQGVYTADKRKLFHAGPFADGTNNIVEFLAIVHALAFCKQHKLNLPIYSDSRIAIGWVKNKQPKTNQERTSQNQKLFELIDRAVFWLKNNSYPNQILKWETKAWGENPADFGRK